MASGSKVPNDPVVTPQLSMTPELRRFLDDISRKIDQLLAAQAALDARVTALEP